MTRLFVQVALATALSASAATSHAGTVEASLAYNTLGRTNTSWLVSGSHSVSDPNSVSIQQEDMVPVTPMPGYASGYSYFMGGGGMAAANGSLSSSVRLYAGGRFQNDLRWAQSVTNTSGNTQQYSMDFEIGSIMATLGGWSGDHSLREFLAGFQIQILVNGVAVWNTATTVGLVHDLMTFSQTGADIGSAYLQDRPSQDGEVYYSHGGYKGATKLGQFADGSTFTVEYLMSTFVDWNDPEGCVFECGGISLDINDPFAIGGGFLIQGDDATGTVPEPGPLALLGVALAAAAWRRRSASRAA
ncbi:MAG: PEP-CTERM sorting domain-containing protein [Inhella sp.]|jgi:hypothetical protein|uniref:PEP-CTERM sorting domain-containing protein n=1 Tax=Inhella sp. TaxID=1921806 RepID=UPI0022BFE2D7|nr:PEP-CTERM sorting domain-containing protein [Inhella sp.]MCZ8234614.1 PEP-CTERM sorting domain-containing protein [Inhella sp.]